MSIKFAWFLVAAMVGSDCYLASAQDAQSTAVKVERIASTIQLGDGRSLDAQIVVPPVDRRNGYGVLLIGGGYGNDLKWTTPGFMEHQGKRIQVSISGRDHHDANRIANSLGRDGFVVMHWSTFVRKDGQPVRQGPAGMIHPIKELYRFSQAAVDQFCETGLFDANQLILVGHSLGGVRAANLAAEDERIDSLVLLGSAQLTRTDQQDRGRNENRSGAVKLLTAMDSNGDGLGQSSEYSRWQQKLNGKDHPLASQSFLQLDFDRDGCLRVWELSAGFAAIKRASMNFDKLPVTDPSGLQWTEDVLQRKQIDTLVLYGALDEAQSHHAPVLSQLVKEAKLGHVQLQVLSGLGHQLGPESAGRMGPIDQRCLSAISKFLNERVEEK